MTALAFPHRRDVAIAAPLAAAVTLAAGLASPALAALCAAAALSFALARGALAFDLRGVAGPALAMLIVGVAWGLGAAVGAFFVWRVLADAGWSAQEGQRLARVAGRAERGLKRAHYFATPVLALAVAAYTAPHLLLGLPLDLPHAPLIAPLVFGFAAAAMLFDWGMRRLTDWRLGVRDGGTVRHAAAHHVLFLAAYVASPDLSAGVMAMIVWRLARGETRYANFTAVP
ncbi:MAG: hypothetical protein GC206_08805 [Alphaproteobacteria bacterium]|nr:hypothetical protein [Alphaproteobacteria bacterium]